MAALLPAAAAAALLLGGAGGGTGCEKRLNVVCPMWKTDSAACLACVAANISALEPNCTLATAEKKCCLYAPCTPAPTPPLPPTPPPTPVPPLPPAPPEGGKPHIILFVVDDQGYANVGYNNPDHVVTPVMDQLSAQGTRLERHYVFRWCAPTRSSLLSGRLPYHVFQQADHVDRNMTLLSAKLRGAGYATHQVGKWHLGNVADWMTPAGRGFDTSLGYLGGGEDHYTQYQKSVNVFGCAGVDLYQTDAPAYGMNGTYGTYIYGAELARIVAAHDAARPLFVYAALQVMHAPQQVPARWSGLYPSPTYSDDFAVMNGMASAADEALGNLTTALIGRGMWARTLLVYTSDNGGPAGQASSGHSGNNWPLRGGKTNFFEGGIRVAAFLSGGYLPGSARGRSLAGYIHGCDWYPTLCTLAGADPADDKSGIPGVDGMDMWPYITGSAAGSPRTEMLIGSEKLGGGVAPGFQAGWAGALISGDYKLLFGDQSYGFWQAPNYPNASTDHSKESPFNCGTSGCLFNIQSDPSEYHDLAGSMPDKLAELHQILDRLNKTTYQAPKVDKPEDQCKAYVAAHKGFLGPYLSD